MNAGQHSFFGPGCLFAFGNQIIVGFQTARCGFRSPREHRGWELATFDCWGVEHEVAIEPC
jgi:hypothetical protein